MMKKIISLFVGLAFLITAKAQQITNPILAGYYPDPSICKAGNDYYLINSTFAYYPGIPIFHSTDLLNWELINYAINRPEQLNLEGAGVSRGLFAPAIEYHNGTFYIVCTQVDGIGNFVITTKDPKRDWSNPVTLPQLNGIDPSLFFDDDGKTYIVYNSTPPDHKPLYDGHRTIKMYEFDAQNLKVIGNEILLVNGGTDLSKKPVWIEGPHLYKINGWYYLTCAEGGTGPEHSQVVFRSKNVKGPFVPYENNPILTQRHLNPNRKNPVTNVGHADIIEAPDGNWWGVFLASRPYKGDYYNTGRETFMAPVKWENDWPVFDLGGEEVKYQYPINAVKKKSIAPFSGNYTFKDKFNRKQLNLRYRFLRVPSSKWYSLFENKNALTLLLRAETVSEKSNPSFVGFHQPHLKGYAATSLKFKANTENEKAGLIAFQNENHFYYLAQSVVNNKQVVQLYKDTALIASENIAVKKNKKLFLKIEADNDSYTFYYATKKNKWKKLITADATFLSTNVAGGFVGSVYAMYATSSGQASSNKAVYKSFEVKSDDDIYK